MDRGRGALLAIAAIAVLIGCGGLAIAAVKQGSGKAEKLVGKNSADRIYGRGGADVLIGRGGRDRLIGGAGPDRLMGGPGQDRLVGGPGRDVINTTPSGYPGAGRGKDLILARDGTEDLIDCGQGYDTVVVDSLEDGLYDCEDIKEPQG